MIPRTLARPDIHVENHGSIVLLRSATATGREWLEANCDPSGRGRVKVLSSRGAYVV